MKLESPNLAQLLRQKISRDDSISFNLLNVESELEICLKRDFGLEELDPFHDYSSYSRGLKGGGFYLFSNSGEHLLGPVDYIGACVGKVITYHEGGQRKHFDPATGEIFEDFILPSGFSNGFRYVNAGYFEMGSEESDMNWVRGESKRWVVLTEPFYIGETLVDRELWRDITKDSPWRIQGDGNQSSQLPASSVTYSDAIDFVRALNLRYQEMTFDLPYEAQFEYASRAGCKSTYLWGNQRKLELALDFMPVFEYGNSVFNRSGQPRIIPLKQFQPNQWGLYDLSGFLYQWCKGWYEYGVSEGLRFDLKGANRSSYHIYRGGSFSGDLETSFRLGHSQPFQPDSRSPEMGVRLVCYLPGMEPVLSSS